jgi:putative ubiquitin-RnfH superfamily antitoxin RatB of RatAB toxin-antitoxin module
MRIEVVYSRYARSVESWVLELAEGATVATALWLSADQVQGPGETGVRQVGIWGRICSTDTLLRDGDRVEIYRPLLIDPKEARRLRGLRAPRSLPKTRR